MISSRTEFQKVRCVNFMSRRATFGLFRIQEEMLLRIFVSLVVQQWAYIVITVNVTLKTTSK